jgi:hypothetical protein
MPKPREKTPQEERALVLVGDHRRKYGARLIFEVRRADDIGGLEHVSLLMPSGKIVAIRPAPQLSWEGGKRYEMEMTGFPTAADAEEAGMRLAQSLLTCAIRLNFGLRLNYVTHEPPSVFDRTVSLGDTFSGELYGAWGQAAFLDEFEKAYAVMPATRRLLLSMELFASASLESNDRARFVMAVSALETLAEQHELGSDVADAIAVLCSTLAGQEKIPADVRSMLRERLLHLKRESVRQALKRKAAQWFKEASDATVAWRALDRAYALRSELLHEGRLTDMDVLLAHETEAIKGYLRRIYEYELAGKARVLATALEVIKSFRQAR